MARLIEVGVQGGLQIRPNRDPDQIRASFNLQRVQQFQDVVRVWAQSQGWTLVNWVLDYDGGSVEEPE